MSFCIKNLNFLKIIIEIILSINIINKINMDTIIWIKKNILMEL